MTKTARGWLLLTVGLFGSLVWAIGVSFAMPRPFLTLTAADVCRQKFDGGFGDNATVELWFFPPSGKCVDPTSHVSQDVFSPAGSVLLSALLVILVLLAGIGAGLLIKQALASPRQPRPASRVRTAVHLISAAVLGIVVSYCSSRLSLIGLLIGDLPGVVAAVGISVAAAIAAATSLDARFGPSTGDALRRGPVVGLIGYAAAIGIAVVGTPDLVLAAVEPTTWRVLAAAFPFAAIVLLQHVTGGLTR